MRLLETVSGLFLSYKEVRQGHKFKVIYSKITKQNKNREEKPNLVFVQLNQIQDLPNPSYINTYNIQMEFYLSIGLVNLIPFPFHGCQNTYLAI